MSEQTVSSFPVREPPWKLSAFYFFYFSLVGGIAPYLPVYLEHTGYGAAEVGQLMSIIMLTKLLAPNFWGWVADTSGKQLVLVRLGAFCATLFFLGFFVANSFWWHALFLVLFSCFWNAVLPQWEVITLYNLGKKREKYSHIRLWGSLGFIAAVSMLGAFFDLFSIRFLPFWLVAFLSGLFLASCLVHQQPGKQGHGGFAGFVKTLGNPEIRIFLIAAFLLQLSFGPYYTFLSIYLKQAGYSMLTIGALWALGVLAEVLLFFTMHRIITRYSLRAIFLTCLLLTAFRWWGISVAVESVLLLVVLQLLHAASFGGLHAASIELVHRGFRSEHAGQAQALYSALSFGAGGALGAYLSGALVEAFSISLAFQAGSVAALVAYLLIWFKRGHLTRIWS